MQLTWGAMLITNQQMESPQGLLRLQYRMIDPQTGQCITGVMVLMQAPGSHFAPFENELISRAMCGSMNFRRNRSVRLDSMIIWLDMIRHQAAQRGGIGIMKAVDLNTDQCDRAQQALNGNVPAT